MDKIRIAIVDTGVSVSIRKCYPVTESYEWKKVGHDKKIVENEGLDTFGHGTAIINIISSISKSVEFINVKIADRKVDSKGIVSALEFIYTHLDVDIINISAGVTELSNYHELDEVCRKLADKNILIISAFDKGGGVTYPAAFDKVIGVDVEKDVQSGNEITIAMNDIVNVRMPNTFHRTVWLNGEKALLKGSSFACAKITGIFANLLLKYQKKINIEEMLKQVMNEGKIYSDSQCKITYQVNKVTR